MRARLHEMYQLAAAVDQESQIEMLHSMRIAVRRLRYTLELLQEGYTEAGEAEAVQNALQASRGLQDVLGSIHDADLMVPRLTGQLGMLLKPGVGNEHGGQPAAGVELVDWEACQGLLTTCMTIAEERKNSFVNLQSLWRQHRQNQVYETLQRLCSKEEEYDETERR